jgi:hypothetical protein
VIAPHKPTTNYSPPSRNLIKITEEVVKPSGSAISSRISPAKKSNPPSKIEKKNEISPAKSIQSKPKSDIDLISQPRSSKVADAKSVVSQNKKSNLSPSKIQNDGQYNVKYVENVAPSSSKSLKLSYAVDEVDRVWKEPIKKPDVAVGFTKYSRPEDK